MLKWCQKSLLTLGTCGGEEKILSWWMSQQLNAATSETRMSLHVLYMSKCPRCPPPTYRWGSCTISLACQMEAVCFCPGPQLGLTGSRWGDSPYSTNETKRNITITRNITAEQHKNKYIRPNRTRAGIPLSSAHCKKIFNYVSKSYCMYIKKMPLWCFMHRPVT